MKKKQNRRYFAPKECNGYKITGQKKTSKKIVKRNVQKKNVIEDCQKITKVMSST